MTATAASPQRAGAAGRAGRGARAAWPLGLLAASGSAWAGAVLGPVACAQAGPDGLAALTRPVAPTPPAASAPPAGKFSLAEAACGPLPGAAGSTLAAPGGAPRRAAQLRLYDTPVTADEPGATGLPPATPRAAARRAAVPSSHAAAAQARPVATGAVQRIRALVPVVADAARRHGIDPLLLHAVAHVESRHQVQARSHAGARGVMQVMPATARRFGLADPHSELLQPALNVDVGAEYLKLLQKRFGNNLALVLAAYNAGEGAVEKHGRRIPPYPETQAYVRDVLAVYAELRRRLGVGAAGAAGSV